jgi:hypothetical protein
MTSENESVRAETDEAAKDELSLESYRELEVAVDEVDRDLIALRDRETGALYVVPRRSLLARFAPDARG